MSVEAVRIGKQARDQLSRLKSRTGITQWNILCRWALCLSLTEVGQPHAPPGGDRPIEMTWKTFGGEYADVYWALVCYRCQRDGLELDEQTISDQLHAHIHRGIAYLAGDPEVKAITGLVSKALEEWDSESRASG